MKSSVRRSRLAPDKCHDMIMMLLEGRTSVQISAATRVSATTVCKHRLDLFRYEATPLCVCGRKINHKGSCWYRKGKQPPVAKAIPSQAQITDGEYIPEPRRVYSRILAGVTPVSKFYMPIIRRR